MQLVLTASVRRKIGPSHLANLGQVSRYSVLSIEIVQKYDQIGLPKIYGLYANSTYVLFCNLYTMQI